MEQNSCLDAVIKTLNEYKLQDKLTEITAAVTKAMNVNNLDNVSLLSRYKSESSIAEKIQRKGYTDPTKVTDLIGVKVVCSSISDVYKVQAAIDKIYKAENISDYYTNPTQAGYTSLHMDCSIGNGKSFELQIKDVVSELKQDYCHDRIYKNPQIPNNEKNRINAIVNKAIEQHFCDKHVPVGYKFSPQDINKFDAVLHRCLATKRTSIADKLKAAKDKVDIHNAAIEPKTRNNNIER